MAIFVVTYRTETGEQIKQKLTAVSCAAALDEVRARRGEPVSVVSQGALWRVFVKGLALGVMVAGLVLAAGMGLVKRMTVPQVCRVEAVEPMTPRVELVEPVKRVETETLSVTTNSTGYVTRIFVENGKRRRVITKLPARQPRQVDELIAWMMNAEPGDDPPTSTQHMVVDDDFKWALTNKICVLKSDGEEIAEMKRAVLATRTELLQLVEKGMDVEQALLTLSSRICSEANIRTEVLVELKSLYDQGDPEGARQFVSEMNAAFEQLGIKPLTLPGMIESPVVHLPKDPQ